MTQDPSIVVRYRTAAVLVLDLAKHSARPKAEAVAIQKIVEEIFASFVQRMDFNPDEVSWAYAGDGYFCTFAGDSGARVLDFLNGGIPALQIRLAPYHQEFRAGLDFGVIALVPNSLTGRSEFFDRPGILARRLEAAAEPSRVLCTDVVYQIFGHHYPTFFGTEAKVLKTKDREILCWELRFPSMSNVQKAVTEFFEPSSLWENEDKLARRILVIDDERSVLETMKSLISGHAPHWSVTTEWNPNRVVETFTPGSFDVIMTDVRMPFMSGFELIARLAVKDEQLISVVFSAYETRPDFASHKGVAGYLIKPWPWDGVIRAIKMACHSRTKALRQSLAGISPEPGELFSVVCRIREVFSEIQSYTGEYDNAAQQMVRHKAKNSTAELLTQLALGQARTESVYSLCLRLESLERFARRTSMNAKEELAVYLRKYLGELGRGHPNLKTVFSFSGFPKDNALPSATKVLLILMICEFLDNAVDALAGKGEIILRVSCFQKRREIIAEVKDSGPGIAAEHVARLFSEGFSTKGKSRGFGLALVAEASRRLGGKVEVTSENGAAFKITIPI